MLGDRERTVRFSHAGRWAGAALAVALLPAAGIGVAGSATASASPSSSLGLPPLSTAQRYIQAPPSRAVLPSSVAESTAVNDDFVQAGSQVSETNGHSLDPGTSRTAQVDGVPVRQAGPDQPGGYFSYTMRAPAAQRVTVRVEEAGSATSDYSVLVNGVQAYHRAPDPQQSGSWDGVDGLVHYEFTVPAKALAPSAAGAPGPGQLRISFVNSAQPRDGARIAGAWVSSPGGSPSPPYGGTVTGASTATSPDGMTISANTFGRPYAIFDFGREVGGQVQLTAVNHGGATGLALAFSESAQYLTSSSDFSEDPVGVATETHQLRIGAGTQQLTDPVIRGGFRYLMVYLDGPGSVSVSDLRLHFTPDPTASDLRAYPGAFLSSSDQLNQLWYAGAYTVQMATIDPATGRPYPAQPGPVHNDAVIASGPTAITDGAKRDRLVWMSDTVEMPTGYLTTANALSAQDSLAWMARGAKPSGEVPGNYLPSGGYDYNFDGEYTSWWVQNYWDNYLYTGDKAFLDQYFPTMTGAINWFESMVGADGLLNIPGSVAGHWGYGDTGEETYDNAFYVRTLQHAASAAEAEGHPGLAGQYRSFAARTANAINAKLWDPVVGAYVVKPGDNAHPQDGNVMAVLAGVATGQRAAATMAFLKTQWGPYGAVTNDSSSDVVPRYVLPFLNYYEMRAYAGQNNAQGTEDALTLLTRVWPHMLTGQDATGTYWENMSLSGGPQLGSYTSLSHGWSAGPVPFLTNEVLGVTPASGGFATFSVLPHPDGGPAWAEGSVPTPHGGLIVRWKRNGRSSFALTVTAPAGTTGTAGVPATGVSRLTVNGQVVWQNGSATRPGVQLKDGYIQVAGVTGTTILRSAIGGPAT